LLKSAVPGAPMGFKHYVCIAGFCATSEPDAWMKLRGSDSNVA
jgi:hypothetical protein